MSHIDMIPTQVDCVLIGTGLTNSILAAALSRVGKSVLHLDKNNYYGDQWASFTLQQLIDWIGANHPESADELNKNPFPEQLLNKSRMFCIDLCPRLLFSNGSMVNLLVKSNVTRYHDFKNNIRILSLATNKDDQSRCDDINVIPCQRSDVFNSPILSNLLDKRKLMKFIELCTTFDQEQSEATNSNNNCDITLNANQPIDEFLLKRGLNETIRGYIINSIAMVDPNESTKIACEKIKNFMIATQRFGKSPFLFPMYGCGEFPQSFCRLSAVFGGVYCLNTHVEQVDIINSDASKVGYQVKLANASKDIVSSEMLIIDNTSAIDLQKVFIGSPLETLLSANRKCDNLSRAILITRNSILPTNDQDLISFMRIPPSNCANETSNLIYLLEFNQSVMVCPPDVNLVYLWTKATNGKLPKEDLEPIVKRLFRKDESEDSINVLWEFYFHQPVCNSSNSDYHLPENGKLENFHITSPPCDDLDYDFNIAEAEAIFKKLCPNEEFLPRAPDPEEIISS